MHMLFHLYAGSNRPLSQRYEFILLTIFLFCLYLQNIWFLSISYQFTLLVSNKKGDTVDINILHHKCAKPRQPSILDQMGEFWIQVQVVIVLNSSTDLHQNNQKWLPTFVQIASSKDDIL